MAKKEFKKFLIELGFSDDDVNQNLAGDTFNYFKSLRPTIQENNRINNDTDSGTIIGVKYSYIPGDNFDKTIFEKHSEFWNENQEQVFIAVTERRTCLINTRIKPNPELPLNENIIIKDFSYGVNSEGFAPKELLELIGKGGIDSAYFFDFVIEKSSHQKTQEVDKDLLLNLIQLRNDLLKIARQPELIHLLILRCLFLKYLEDRGIYENDYLVQILKTGSIHGLLAAFEEIRRINGDIFKYDEFTIDKINPAWLPKLATFFSCFDYRTGQGSLFPYNFAKIPIQLISHVYEAFLSNAHKGNKGIYYTPAFIVRFMLAHSLLPKLKEKPDTTVLDPACGSGAFLVEAFREMIKSQHAENDYTQKVTILKKQLFGIDIDPQALQIAAFSLYLTLLEGEKTESIQEKIRHAHPILPALINHNLIHGNSLTDEIYPGMTFDCVVANPPWGAVPSAAAGDTANRMERSAIGEKGKIGRLDTSAGEMVFPEYQNVSDYQRSQAFLLRIDKWCQSQTIGSLIVNNSIFLNENATDFRTDLLNRYRITRFYELSHLNKILFKKRQIGQIRTNGKNETLEIGASEPCVVLVFDKKEIRGNVITYISPKLTRLAESFKLIHYSQKDIKTIKQTDLQQEDYWIWRIFVNGSWADYQLIKQKYLERTDLHIECTSGFQPLKNPPHPNGNNNRELITVEDFGQYSINKTLKLFNWNQKLRRNPEIKKPDVFQGNRVLIPVRPLDSDRLRMRGIRVAKNIVHKDNILSIKIEKNHHFVPDYAPYLAILNSSFLGYYIFQISSQWGKGEEKRSTLRNSDLEKLPFPEIDETDERVQKLIALVEKIEAAKKANQNTNQLEQQIDELVFDLYGLSDYEKEIIREFYQINVERERNPKVTQTDLQQYLDEFRAVFHFILADNQALNATYRISANLGAYICFTLVNKGNLVLELKPDHTADHQLLNIVKQKQLSETYFSHKLNEDRVKIYGDNQFFIIKSHFFKDWTVRQAIDDANEEIGLILKDLPNE